MSSAAASIPLQDRPEIEDLSPEYREVVREVARRIGQTVENEIVMGFSAYIIARVAASANIEDGEDMEEDEDKENRVPEGGQNGEIGDTSIEVPMHGEERGGDVHTEEDLAAVCPLSLHCLFTD